MIFIALWDPPGQPRRPRSVLDAPRVKAYYENWDPSEDVGLIAELDGQPVGLVNCRVKKSVTEEYKDYPEAGISVLPEFEGRGIGSILMQSLIDRAKKTAKGLRLGVHPENERAIALYKKFGFRFYAQPEGQYPQMVLNFS